MAALLFVTREARLDIDDIFSFLAKENQRAAAAFLAAAKSTFDLLCTYPRLGSLRRHRDRRLRGIRSCPIRRFRQYLVFYTPRADGIVEIKRVLHGARDVDRLIRRS